jgi:hypothetical protein
MSRNVTVKITDSSFNCNIFTDHYYVVLNNWIHVYVVCFTYNFSDKGQCLTARYVQDSLPRSISSSTHRLFQYLNVTSPRNVPWNRGKLLTHFIKHLTLDTQTSLAETAFILKNFNISGKKKIGVCSIHDCITYQQTAGFKALFWDQFC